MLQCILTCEGEEEASYDHGNDRPHLLRNRGTADVTIPCRKEHHSSGGRPTAWQIATGVLPGCSKEALTAQGCGDSSCLLPSRSYAALTYCGHSGESPVDCRDVPAIAMVPVSATADVITNCKSLDLEGSSFPLALVSVHK